MRQTFTDLENNLERVEINKYESGHAEMFFSDAEPSQFGNTFVPSPTERSKGQRIANLVLVHIERTKSFEWKISRDGFDTLFDHCGLDQYVLYPMTRGVDGFYCIGDQTTESMDAARQTQDGGPWQGRDSFGISNSSDDRGQSLGNTTHSNLGGCQENQVSLTNNRWSYLICVRGTYMLAWTFYPKTKCTRAILISYTPGFTYAGLKTELQRQKMLIGYPLFLAFVDSVRLTGLVHTHIHNAERQVFRVEDQTKHSPWTSPEIFSRPDEEDNDNEALAVLTRSISSVVILLALQSRRLSIAKRLTKAILDSKPDSSYSSYAEHESDLISMRRATLLLDPTIETSQVYIQFLQERSKTQLTVLFNLIAQRDANANIELAKASRTVALASQHDSESMKTIAVMTMVFLPGTFLATLFDTPFLQWDGSRFIQSGFWMFWVITIPTTALVFALWFGITKRHAIRTHMANTWQETKVDRRSRRPMNRVGLSNDDYSDQDEIAGEDHAGDDQPFDSISSWAQRMLRNRIRRSQQDPGLDVELENTAAHHA